MNISRNAHGSHSSGVTLTEVLMSLMIMSIGVTSVAVLFPISMLRSLQATQLTNAAIVRYNVETLLESQPDLIFDPDGDGDFVEHFRTPARRNYIVDPSGYYTLGVDLNPFATMFGNDGTAGVGTLERFGGGLRTLQGINETSPGVTALDLEALKLAGQTLASQGDGYTDILDAVPAAVSSTSVTFGSSVDLSDIPSSSQLVSFVGSAPRIVDPELFEVVLFSNGISPTGQNARVVSAAFPLLAVDAGAKQVFFSEDNTITTGADFNGNGVLDRTTLPATFGSPPSVSRVLLRARRTNDFQWFLTVRRRGDGAVRNIDVVVKFSDGVDASTERVFPTAFVRGSNIVGVGNAADGTVPNIVKGKFIFDATNAIWYRIQDVQTAPLIASGPFSWGTYQHRVLLETDAQASAGSDGTDDGVLNGSSTASFGGAMFLPGIVDVYPMGSRSMPTNAK